MPIVLLLSHMHIAHAEYNLITNGDEYVDFFRLKYFFIAVAILSRILICMHCIHWPIYTHYGVHYRAG